MRFLGVASSALVLAVGLPACAEWDNPVALSELNPEVEFEIEAARVETFEEVEISVRVSESGAPLEMYRSQLRIRHADGGDIRTVDVESDEHGYGAHVRFFEPGEYHIEFMGMPKGHALIVEMGEHELEVHRQHRVIGPYWVELSVSPAPVLENTAAHVAVLVFELTNDGKPGALASGLDIEMAIHSPDENETVLMVEEEEPGEYEGEYNFGETGLYELEVEILVDASHEEGEFHIPVSAPGDEDGPDEEGGDGHGH